VQRARGLLVVAGLAASGAVVGIVGAFVQAISLSIGGVRMPIGAVVAVTMTTVAVRAGARLVHQRAGAIAVAAGWVVTVLWMSVFPTSEGDIILASSTSALMYVYGGVLLAAFAAAFPVRPAASGSEARS
jgi:Family of unknown function (DUF6113)